MVLKRLLTFTALAAVLALPAAAQRGRGRMGGPGNGMGRRAPFCQRLNRQNCPRLLQQQTQQQAQQQPQAPQPAPQKK
jgi:hypothetical protein